MGRAGRGGARERGGTGRARGGERVRGARTHLDTGLPDVDGDDLTHGDWGLVARRRRRRRKVSKDAVRGRADSERPRGARGGYIVFL